MCSKNNLLELKECTARVDELEVFLDALKVTLESRVMTAEEKIALIRKDLEDIN